MSIREWINKNSAVATIVAVVILVISLGILIMNLGGGRRGPVVKELYYYDLNTGKVFTAPVESLPPVKAPSDPDESKRSGVQAYIMACGECPSNIAGATAEELAQRNVFIVRLEKYDDRTRDQLVKMMEQQQQAGPEGPPPMMVDPFLMEEGRLVKPLQGDRWVPIHSPAGMQIMESLQRRCEDGTNPKFCYPGM